MLGGQHHHLYFKSLSLDLNILKRNIRFPGKTTVPHNKLNKNVRDFQTDNTWFTNRPTDRRVNTCTNMLHIIFNQKGYIISNQKGYV